MENVKDEDFIYVGKKVKFPRKVAEKIKEQLPQSYASMVSYEFQAMQRYDAEKAPWEEYEERMGNKNKDKNRNKKISTEHGVITLFGKNDLDEWTARGLTARQINVLTAVFTLMHINGKPIWDSQANFLSGKHFEFTMVDLLYVMTGKKVSRRVAMEMLSRNKEFLSIHHAIESLRNMSYVETKTIVKNGKDADMDAIEEVQSTTIERIGDSSQAKEDKDKQKADIIPSISYLFPVDIEAGVEDSAIGKIKYRMLGVPPYFINAERFNRVIRVSMENIRIISEKVNMKTMTIAIRDFLLWRIARLCNDVNNQYITTISLQKLYKHVESMGYFDGLSEGSKKNLMTKIRKIADAILQSWEAEKELSDEDVARLQEQHFKPKEIELCKHYIFGEESYLVSHKFNRASKAGRGKARQGQPYTSIDLQFDAATEQLIAKSEADAKAYRVQKAAKQAIKEANAAKAESKKGND